MDKDMDKKKVRIEIFKTKYFGFIIGFIVFVIFFILSFGLNVIYNIEQDFFLDTFFNLKYIFREEIKEDKVTQKGENPFVSSDIIIIGIEKKSLASFGKWPFPRSIEASMINSLTRISDQSNRELALFLDINFIEQDIKIPGNDALLVNSIKENGRVFLETFLLKHEPSYNERTEHFSRQKLLIENYGEITNIKGDISNMPTFRSVEAPLKPYARAVKGYGHVTFTPDIDNVFRRQALISRLSEMITEIRLCDLTPAYTIDKDNFERLVWIDKNDIIHTISYPLTNKIIENLKIKMKTSSPSRSVDTDGDGKPDKKYYIVLKYKDHFIPAITISLAVQYFNKDISDIEVVMGKYIRIPDPEVFNKETREWEPYKIHEIIIPIDKKGAMLINYAGPSSSSSSGYQTFSVRPFYGYVFRDPGYDPSAWRSSMTLDNMMVMVGMFATGLDEKPTPLGHMYGVEINANSLNTILMNRFLSYIPWWMNALILFFMIMLISFMTSRLSTLLSLACSVLSIFVFFIIVLFFFDFSSLIITFSAPALGIMLTFLAIVAYRVMTEEKDKKRIKNMFGKYVSPAVVEQMMTYPPELGGVDKELTVLFSDIRGFTTMSENMSPQALVNHLNTYLTVMTDIILEFNGTLDKYVGDEIMCFWGAPLPQAEHALLACKCAIKQMAALKELNNGWPAEKQIDIGIGLNSGIMTVGNMGSQGRMNYTLMGDNVNLGARLEGTNKQYHTNIIISENTYGLVKDNVIARELDDIRVKGKNKPVVIYELIDTIDVFNDK